MSFFHRMPGVVRPRMACAAIVVFLVYFAPEGRAAAPGCYAVPPFLAVGKSVQVTAGTFSGVVTIKAVTPCSPWVTATPMYGGKLMHINLQQVQLIEPFPPQIELPKANAPD